MLKKHEEFMVWNHFGEQKATLSELFLTAGYAKVGNPSIFTSQVYFTQNDLEPLDQTVGTQVIQSQCTKLFVQKLPLYSP